MAAYGWMAGGLPPVYDYEPGEPLDREAVIIEALKACGHDIQCLGVTKQGDPKHPLYLKADTQPRPYRHGGKAL